MKYSVVIPTYNHCEDLLKPCVETLLKYSDVWDIELIISANGCTDSTHAYLTELHGAYSYMGMEDHIKIIWNEQPLGYSKATNAGIKVATSDLIVLLNNDVIFLEQYRNRWLDILAHQFDINPNCGVSCIIKGMSEPAGHEFAVFFCVMIHRKVFDAIGLLNEEYGVGGGEDTEFSIESERAGFEVCPAVTKEWSPKVDLYVGDFPVYHKGEGTMHDDRLVPNWADIFEENALRLAKKYNPAWYQLRMDKKVTDNQNDLSWLRDAHPEIYREVIDENCYAIASDKMIGRTVVDIGANIGVFSIFAGSLGAKRVVSLEPVSNTFHQLTENVRRSGIGSIEMYQNAVSTQTGEFVNISLNANSGHNSMFNVAERFETVETLSFSDLLASIEDRDIFLKVDCEGAEYDILLTANPTEMEKITDLVIEVHADTHPIYKGFDILNDKVRSFGFKLKDVRQMFTWMLDPNGNIIEGSMKPIPYRVEIWSR